MPDYDGPYKTLVYYINDSDGDTFIFDKFFNKEDSINVLKDIDKIMDYANNLSNLDIENTDLDEFEKEINSLSNDFNEKYKDFLPKDNLDSKK